MARSFTSRDAKRLISEHREIQNKLKEISTSGKRYREEITVATNKLVTKEVLEVLKGIPVDEVNRDKRGIKIKALKDAGFTTVAQLFVAPVSRIASIRGISEDTAYTIKHIVNDLVEEAKNNTKIRLSVDKKTAETTALVKAISKYRKWEAISNSVRSIEKQYNRQIQYALEDVLPGTSGMKWLFCSAGKKEKAGAAYELLVSFLNGEYEKNASEIIEISDQTERLQSSEAWEDFQENSIRFFTILEDLEPGVLGTSDAVYGLPEELAREIQDQCFFPDGLMCTLRRYQEWGVKYILHQEKVLLGDEMGLGKTVQAIATMVSLKNTGATHFIVVCPASVLTNWCREIEKHSRLLVTKIHGWSRLNSLESWIKTGGVAVTTYETTAYLKLDKSFKYSLCIVDEAHYIKNPSAQRTINVIELCEKAERLLFMTGTALENKVEEMISLIGVLQPRIASNVKGLAFMATAPQFREKVAPVYYRRKREDVLTELPELIEYKEWCTLSAQEEQMYEQSVLSKNYADVRRVSWNVNDLKNSSKARRLKELVAEAKEDGRKVIVFSFFLDTIRKVCMLLEDQCTNPINGSISPQRRQEIIDEFDKAPAGTVLPAQIQSGGTGLNIQSASVVIICEPQFKPSIENQAISRAYRMGQARNVLVYRLLCENTVDERITELLSEKQAIFDAFADKSVAVAETEKLEVDEKSFGNIIKEEIKRINKKNANEKNQ